MLKVNGIEIGNEPKAVISSVLCSVNNIQYWSKSALIRLYLGALKLSIDAAEELKGGKHTRFKNLTKRRVDRFEENLARKTREDLLITIYNEILAGEGFAPLRGFGFSNKFGDRIAGNSETQTVFPTEGGRLNALANKAIKINQEKKEELIMSTLKRSQLIAAAKELNEQLGLEPAIDTKPGKKNSYLQEMITEAGQLVDPNQDELADETWEVLKALGIDTDTKAEGESEPEEEQPEEGEGKPDPDPEPDRSTELVQVETPTPEPEKPAKGKKKDKGAPAKDKPAKEKAAGKKKYETTVLGSRKGSQAETIDNAILSTKKSQTIEELMEKTGFSKGRIKIHLKHLIEKKGFEIDAGDGKYKAPAK